MTKTESSETPSSTYSAAGDSHEVSEQDILDEESGRMFIFTTSESILYKYTV
ncbi:hypothetical protein VCRA2120O389_310037 [Vibrio crassostreae]|nr:hypothetical protein VCRA2113O356_370038 [Vibrio crassostreae]CAK2749970.1 hypothetical protein VCRA2117O375_290023 [Vibrio crassostreae]CAK2879440.1 hypothetical protein VCRA2133O403_290037 [Vibrio crassostreae]CAK2939180.1 hypothetical protein VCRA2120O390_310037 [Vibrio crassostreae]CAK2943822.1 hypothetical protein VCRA2133O401_310037 [Vibrio crassostreae]